MHKASSSAIAALAAILSLSACSSEPETITSGPVDPTAEKVAAAPPVELPPAVSASNTYRCKDNSLVYVDFFSNNTTANLRTDKAGTPTPLTAPAAGEAFAGGGYTVSGSGSTVTITQPGKPAQSCKA